jgi:hypothetical protein
LIGQADVLLGGGGHSARFSGSVRISSLFGKSTLDALLGKCHQQHVHPISFGNDNLVGSKGL